MNSPEEIEEEELEEDEEYTRLDWERKAAWAKKQKEKGLFQ